MTEEMSDKLRKIIEPIIVKVYEMGGSSKASEWVVRKATLEWARDELLKLFDKPLPTNEEINIQIIHCLYGGMSVPELENWFREKFR